MRTMSIEEAAWIGATIDAEGGPFWHAAGQRDKHPYPIVTCANTDLEIISALLRATGIGSVSAAMTSALSNKLCYIWTVGARKEVVDVLRQCKPYSPKMQRFGEEALEKGLIDALVVEEK